MKIYITHTKIEILKKLKEISDYNTGCVPSMQYIYTHSKCSYSTINITMREFEKLKLIIKHKKGRVCKIELTKKGKEAIENIERFYNEL